MDKVENESNEDIEDLLSEYHHYLEKAHKQRVNYLEKTKPKNKVPIIRHEKYSKMKSPAVSKYDYFRNNIFKPEHTLPQALNPFNMFIPFTNKYEMTSEPSYNNDLSAIKKIMFNDESPISTFASIPVKAPCCKDGRANCKQCFMSVNGVQQGPNPIILPLNDDKMYNLNNPMSPERADDTINIRIKVDVQLPKFQADRDQFYDPQSRDKMSDYDAGVSKEYLSAIKLPSPYFNFPFPMNSFGYKKIPSKNNKHDTQNPLHKIAIHKKKKLKVGNTNKKHRKKVITFHNIKIEPELSFAMFNLTVNAKNKVDNTSAVTLSSSSNKSLNEDVSHIATTPVENVNVTETQTEENVLLLVNITNSIDNGTTENHKTENSIETDYTNALTNATTEKTVHLIRKREILHKDKPIAPKVKSTTPHMISPALLKNSSSATKIGALQNKLKKKFPKKNTAYQLMTHKMTKSNLTFAKLEKAKSNKKLDKSLPTDFELLYWPNTNITKSNEIIKNITVIILENENKKGKLNMTTKTMRHNHTRALEQAIFGDVDWNDVDSVAPAFISFVGKYIEGIITFCNERICHSMKCTKQNCLHRFCAVKHRFNKGHCTGSNNTGELLIR